ncbi:hypothetical protein HY256_08270 [Candidatus Sumerlaeota bacterium]|nr:hypothetical protein [Candidatus Sumerlaeota bacterium]
MKQNLAEEEKHPFYCGIAGKWLERLGASLGSQYILHDTPQIIFLLPGKGHFERDFIEFAVKTLKRIRSWLGNLALTKYYGKYTIILIADGKDYWRYTSHFHPDNSTVGGSIGVFISAGYGHIVMVRHGQIAVFGASELDGLQSTLVHELTHNNLWHLRLPRWLDEGMAMHMQIDFHFLRPLLIDAELLDGHLKYWDERTIQDFWKGKSFHFPGDGQKLSYELAEILLRIIIKDCVRSPDQFIDFIKNARCEDAGDGSCREYFGASIGKLLSTFLGEQDWEPKLGDDGKLDLKQLESLSRELQFPR